MSRLLRGSLVAVAMLGSALMFSDARGAQEFEPSLFTAEVTNPYFPLPVGTMRVYEGQETDPESSETHEFRIEERVLAEPFEVMGVPVTVLEVTEYEDGELIEVTRDYHAQHEDGSVWYFGEHVDNFEDGVLVDHDGTWIAGEGENLPSLFIPAEPKVFDTMLQERAPGEAEDISTVVEIGLSISVPAGAYEGCIKTVDINPLEVTSEWKHYCPGAGLVREENADGVTELVSIQEDGAMATPSARTASATK
jgi:hypothetical protein